MPSEPTLLITTTVGGLVLLGIGIFIGWLAARPAQVRLQERLNAMQGADASLRETFRALSDEALKSNNQAFLELAETRMRDARTSAV